MASRRSAWSASGSPSWASESIRPWRGGQFTDPLSFDPVLWLRSDQDVFEDTSTNEAEDTDPVAKWGDLSINTNHFLQSTLSNRPIYHLNQINGHPAIVFDGVDDFFDITDFTPDSVPDVTLFMVLAVESNDGDFEGLFSFAPGSGNDFETGLVTDQTTDSSVAFDRVGVEGAKGGTNTDLLVTSYAFGTWVVLSLEYNAARTQLWSNATAESTRSTDDTVVDTPTGRIGKRPYAAGTPTTEMSVAEVIAYGTKLRSAERKDIEQYLIDRYAL